MFEFVCDVMPVATGKHAELLCAAVLSQSNQLYSGEKTADTPSKLVLTVHVADDMGSEATLKMHDYAGHARESARLGVTTTDKLTPAVHSNRLAKILLADLQRQRGN